MGTFIKKMLYLIVILFTYSFQQIYAQQITSEKALFYYLAVNKYAFKDYIDLYGSVFDPYNYSQSKSDEFENNSYREKIQLKLSRGVKSINFSNKFYTTGYGQLGEYSFTDKSFPILLLKSYDNQLAFSLGCCANINIAQVNEGTINKFNFSWSLKMSAEQAKAFLKKRKDNQGNIDRRIYFKATYSILDRKGSEDSGYHHFLSAYYYSIELDDDNFRTKLTTIYPSTDYFDKIHGVKMKEGQETIYYKYNGFRDKYLESPQKEGADYYRIINYSDGKIINVKEYYLSGKLLSEGIYDQYCAESGFENGHFIYYYKNGFKKEEVDIINGQKNGCDYKWMENGKCANSNCSCTDQKEKPITNGKSSELTLNDFSSFKNPDSGKEYKIIVIGTQTWMIDNLDESNFCNGDVIPEVKTQEEWKNTRVPAWCYYDNNPINEKKFGKLYNWYAVNDRRGLAPKGWHIATENDYRTLIKMVDDGNALKSIDQGKGEGAGTNTSGFSVLLGGYRSSFGNFDKMGYVAEFWSSTENGNIESAKYIYLEFDNSKINIAARYSGDAYSLRCVKD